MALPGGGEVSAAEPGAVQRAVGYEFETGWLVSEQLSPLHEKKSLKKKDQIAQMRGFSVEADEAAGGASEVEFVVDPPVAVHPTAREDLAFTMNYIEIFGTDMLRAGAASPTFGLDEITGRQADYKIQIEKGDEALAAGPQVTSGISLERIAAIGKLGERMPGGFGRSVRTIESITATIDEANLRAFLPDGVMSDKLRGLVSLLVSLIWGGQNRGLEYPKQIADVFLLGRTNLAATFALLPEADRTFYQQGRGPWKFVDLVLTAAGVPGTEDTPLIEHGVRPQLGAQAKPIGPTRGKWLFFLTSGFDLLSREYNEEFESMGALGSRTEPVGPRREQAPIFELRGAQTTKIPLRDWKPFALAVFDALLSLESD